MKKNKLKKLVKSARKTIKKNIKLSLVAELQSLTGKLNQDSKKLAKEIEKGSKELAKKISKGIKIDKSTLVESSIEAKVPDVTKISDPVLLKPEVTVPTKTEIITKPLAKVKTPPVPSVTIDVTEKKS